MRHGATRQGGGAATDLDALLREATAAGASDLHLTVEAPPVLRVHGVLRRLEGPPVAPGDTEQALRRLATAEQVERLRLQGEVDFSYSLPGVGRFRVAAYRQRGSVALAVRPIPSRIPDLRELGVPASAVSLVRSTAGLVLVAGRAGSGKSTTLAALVELINRERAAHVITLEDPVEYLHRHQRSIVHQREVGSDCPGFAPGLRAALRSDPDVLVVGDLPDAETVQAALGAATTGHLVVAAVTQPDCASALEHLVTLFPTAQQPQVAWQLAAVLEGGLAQVLLPRADGTGRVAAFEVVTATPAVRTLVREARYAQVRALQRAGARHGMCTLESAWRDLCARGLCAAEQAPPFPVTEPAGGG